ncbi:hypothetical protein C8J57DRAFT_1255075 [Mycena rebaudengoi]|nr:hypothetical protein C8J57DRAFT_1255075 [Mycena rebaudengoi]
MYPLFAQYSAEIRIFCGYRAICDKTKKCIDERSVSPKKQMTNPSLEWFCQVYPLMKVIVNRHLSPVLQKCIDACDPDIGGMEIDGSLVVAFEINLKRMKVDVVVQSCDFEVMEEGTTSGDAAAAAKNTWRIQDADRTGFVADIKDFKSAVGDDIALRVVVAGKLCGKLQKMWQGTQYGVEPRQGRVGAEIRCGNGTADAELKQCGEILENDNIIFKFFLNIYVEFTEYGKSGVQPEKILDVGRLRSWAEYVAKNEIGEGTSVGSGLRCRDSGKPLAQRNQASRNSEAFWKRKNEIRETISGGMEGSFPPMPLLKPNNLLSLLFLKQGDLGFPDGNLFSQSLEPCAPLCGREG